MDRYLLIFKLQASKYKFNVLSKKPRHSFLWKIEGFGFKGANCGLMGSLLGFPLMLRLASAFGQKLNFCSF
jgi:hypothetical protein